MIALEQYIRKMPALNATTLEINRILSDANHGMQDIIRVVEKDPVLSSELLKYANSPMYGFTSEITSVARAISLFGVQQVRAVAVMSSVKNDNKVDLSPYGTDERTFLDASLAGAVLISKWRSRAEQEVLYISAFLMFLGKILCANALKAENQIDAFKQSAATNGIDSAEKEFFGMNSMEASALILEKYKMHPDAVSALKHAYDYKTLPDLSKERSYSAIINVLLTLINLKERFSKEQINKAVEVADLEALDSPALLNAINAVKQ